MNDKCCHHTTAGRLFWTFYNCIPNEKKEWKKQSGESGSYGTNGWTLVVKWMLSTLTDMPWKEFPKEVNEYACHSRSWNNHENFCYDIMSESLCDNSNQIANMDRHWNCWSNAHMCTGNAFLWAENDWNKFFRWNGYFSLLEDSFCLRTVFACTLMSKKASGWRFRHILMYTLENHLDVWWVVDKLSEPRVHSIFS